MELELFWVKIDGHYYILVKSSSEASYVIAYMIWSFMRLFKLFSNGGIICFSRNLFYSLTMIRWNIQIAKRRYHTSIWARLLFCNNSLSWLNINLVHWIRRLKPWVGVVLCCPQCMWKFKDLIYSKSCMNLMLHLLLYIKSYEMVLWVTNIHWLVDFFLREINCVF